MKILVNLQFSMRSYETKKFLIWNDAQFNKFKPLIEKFILDGHQIFMIIPEFKSIEEQSVVNLLKLEKKYKIEKKNDNELHDKLIFITIPYASNALTNRYNFFFHAWRSIIHMIKPDVCLNEICTLTKNIYAVQEDLGYKFPIISAVEHLDIVEDNTVFEKVSYFLRQCDGLLASDLAIFPMTNMRELFVSSMKQHFEDKILEQFLFRTRIWRHYFSTNDVGKIGRKNKEKVIFFGSRLSDVKRTKYDLFFEAINLLWKQRQDFKVIVANPNDAQPWSWIEAMVPKKCLHDMRINSVDAKSREAYMKAIKMSHISAVLYRMDELYSVGFNELLYCKNLVVTPRCDVEHLPTNYIGFIKEITPESISAKFNKLLNFLSSKDYKKYVSRVARDVAFEASGESNAKKIIGDIENVYKKFRGIR